MICAGSEECLGVPVNSSLNRNGGSLGISFFSFALRSAIPCRSNAADQKSTGLGDEAANELLI